MRDIYRKFSRSSWRDTFYLELACFIGWIVFGLLFSSAFFDTHMPYLRLLDSRADALVYASVLFVIEIPVFILLLQKMTELGFVRRLIMPGIISFREILVSFILLSLYLLLSPRASFYYFPILGITGLCLYAVFIAVQVLFDIRKLEDKEKAYVRTLVQQVIADLPKRREKSNSFFEVIKKSKFVAHVFFMMPHESKSMTPLIIRSNHAGLIMDIDISQLETLLAQRYDVPIDESSATSQDSQATETPEGLQPKLILEVRPGATVKSQATLMRLMLPQRLKAPDKDFLDKLQNAVDIDTAIADSSSVKLDNLIADFKQQIRDAVDKDNIMTIQQSLEFYGLLLEGFADFSSTAADSGYSFSNAKEEFYQVFGDSMSEWVKSISMIVNDELIHSIQAGRQATCKELIGFTYGQMLDLVHDYDVLKAALVDDCFTRTALRVIFDDSREQDPSLRAEAFESITFRLKEHLGVLIYNYMDADGDTNATKLQLKQWIESRIGDARGLLLGTYKKSNDVMFSQALAILEEVEKEYQLYEGEITEFANLTRCNLFVIAAYIHSHDHENTEQQNARQLVDNILAGLGAQELTDLLVTCIDKDYADKWRVDMYDLTADGEMHEVPDFKIQLKKLWADYILRQGAFPTNVESYEAASTPLNTTLTFSEGLPDDHEPYLIRHLNELAGQGTARASELSQLVQGFIDKRRNWEANKLMSATLSPDKVHEFSQDVLDGYTSKAIAVSIFQPHNKLQYVDRAARGYKMFGWNRVNDKEAFIDDWHSGYIMQGKEQGSEIARAQNKFIANALLAKSTTYADMESWITKLRDSKSWLIVSVEVSPWFIRQEYEKYIATGTEYNDVQFKKVKHLPIEHIYSDSLPKGLYAVRVGQIGTLKIKPADDQLIDIQIDAYSDNQALLNGMLNDPPQWLRDMGDRVAQENFLKRKVRMYIYSVFKYMPEHNAEVLYLPINQRHT